MNAGILEPEVASKALSYSKNNDIPINSTEGFVRQIIGWREFIRECTYAKEIIQELKTSGTLPEKYRTFYDGTTGIEPRYTIKTIIETGYCHHMRD